MKKQERNMARHRCSNQMLAMFIVIIFGIDYLLYQKVYHSVDYQDEYPVAEANIKRNDDSKHGITDEDEKNDVPVIPGDLIPDLIRNQPVAKPDHQKAGNEYGKAPQNAVFIKMTSNTHHDMVSPMLYRYALNNQLAVAITSTRTPKKRVITLKNDERPRGSFYRSMVEPFHQRYNMLLDDVVYNRIEMDAVVSLPHYVVILENPVEYFKSQLVFFMHKLTTEFGKAMKPGEASDILTWFMEDPEKYFDLMQDDTDNDETYLEWRRLRNGQSYMLGLKESEQSKKYVEDIMNFVSYNFDLILIAEYLDESLLLLKKELCLNWKDIFYLPVHFVHQMSQVPKPLLGKVQEWNWLDVELYNHFNKTFWEKVSDYGAGFQEDLAYLRTSLQNLREVCTTGKVQAISDDDSNIPTRYEFPLLESASDACRNLTITAKDYIRIFKEKQGTGQGRKSVKDVIKNIRIKN